MNHSLDSSLDINKNQAKRTSSTFRQEFWVALILCAAVLVFAVWPFLMASGNSYPATVDGLGHLTRAQYLADCLKDGIWPSWFPYWYNGSTVTQYYPPLSFLLLAIVQIITSNITISFVVFIFFSQLIGAMGVWYFCYRFIGPMVGIIGGVFYALQPYLLRMLFMWGSIAQGPIFALTPWLLCFSLLFWQKRTPLRWILLCLTGSALILSQPMHAYIISICMGVVLLLLLLQKRIALVDAVLWVISIALGVIIMGFWVLPGVTHMEHPFVPYMLPGASTMWAAHLNWFDPRTRPSGEFYFSLAMLVLAISSVFHLKKGKSPYLILPLLGAMIVSICLSFGDNFPLYRFIPMHENLVTGRFLSFGVLAATILSIYVFNNLIQNCYSATKVYKPVLTIMLSAILVIVLIDINPSVIPVETKSFSKLNIELKEVSQSGVPFQQGRFSPISSKLGCQVTYLPMLNDLNITDGWSIEGTPHNRTLWQHHIAITSLCTDYVIKNLLHWNTRSIFIDRHFSDLINGLVNTGFKEISSDPQSMVLFNPTPSSYFLNQQRNAIAIGRSAPGLTMTFPWMIQGQFESLEDYSSEYINEFQIIYLAEPEVKDFYAMQRMVKELAGLGKTVIVEMGHRETWPLFDVIPYWEKVGSGSILAPTSDSPYTLSIPLKADPNGRYPAMGNLDGIWLEMKTGDKHVPALGYKNVNGYRVYFVGLALGQNLQAAVKRNYGFEADSPHSKEFTYILEQLMSLGNPNKNWVPNAFPVSNAKWGHSSFSFKYDSVKPSPVLISVTYTPRWKASIDGVPLAVNNLENLMLVKLPAGKHQVEFNYGMTWVGWTGIALSVLSLLLMFIMAWRLEQIADYIKSLGHRLMNYIAKIPE